MGTPDREQARLPLPTLTSVSQIQAIFTEVFSKYAGREVRAWEAGEGGGGWAGGSYPQGCSAYVDRMGHESGHLDRMLDEVGECGEGVSVRTLAAGVGAGAGGALKLRAYIALPKDLNSVPSTRVRGLTAACNSGWLRRHFHVCPNPHIHTH